MDGWLSLCRTSLSGWAVADISNVLPMHRDLQLGSIPVVRPPRGHLCQRGPLLSTLGSTVILMLIAGLCNPGIAAATPYRPRQVAVLTNQGGVIRPGEIQLTLNRPMAAQNLVWSSWGPTKATARGTLWAMAGCDINHPVPDCDKSPAIFVLTDPVDTFQGWFFRNITIQDRREHPWTMALPAVGAWPAPALPGYLWIDTFSDSTEAVFLQVSWRGGQVTGTIQETLYSPNSTPTMRYASGTAIGTVSGDTFSLILDDRPDGFLIKGLATLVFTYSRGDLLSSWSSYFGQDAIFVPVSPWVWANDINSLAS